MNHCGQWILMNDWCGNCGGCGCGADNSNPHNRALNMAVCFNRSTPFHERKKRAEIDSSEVPQLVRSQSVQSLTTNLHALAEELTVRSLRELLSTCGSNLPLEHSPKPFTSRHKGIPFISGFGDCLGCVLGVCCNDSGLELQGHCKASPEMHCKTMNYLLQRLTATARGPTLLCIVEIH